MPVFARSPPGRCEQAHIEKINLPPNARLRDPVAVAERGEMALRKTTSIGLLVERFQIVNMLYEGMILLAICGIE